MKILVVQQKMIGDVLLSSMICEQIKKNISNSNVHYLINSNTEAVVMNNPYIDHIVFFTDEYRNNKWSFYKFLKNIAREKYDVIIDAYGKLESMLISLFSKANIRISIDKWYSRHIYTKTFKYLTAKNSHLGLAVENRLKLLKPLINDLGEITHTTPPKIHLSDSEILKARLFLEKNNVNFYNPIIMINVLGSSNQKTYPLFYMAEVINQIASHGKYTILFNYIPSQLKQARKLYNLCSPETKSKIRFDIYTPLLRNFLGVLYHCNALIGNEGGAINLAKAVNVPTFSIFCPWVEKATWETFKDTKNNVAVHLNDYYPSLIKGKSNKRLKEETKFLYTEFKPDLFEEKIRHFLNLQFLYKKPNLAQN